MGRTALLTRVHTREPHCQCVKVYIQCPKNVCNHVKIRHAHVGDEKKKRMLELLNFQSRSNAVISVAPSLCVHMVTDDLMQPIFERNFVTAEKIELSAVS